MEAKRFLKPILDILDVDKVDSVGSVGEKTSADKEKIEVVKI